MYVSIGFKR